MDVFYRNSQVHKQHEHSPQTRPLISGSGSITENIAIFVEHHLKHIANKHDTYLQDTPDFLRRVEEINQGPRLDPKIVLCTWDEVGLFTNIAHDEGIEVMQEKHDKRSNPKVPTDFLVALMEIILNENIFEFLNSYWKQKNGAAMGSPPIPHYANLFMTKIDKQIRNLAKKYNEKESEALAMLKRFLDDYI